MSEARLTADRPAQQTAQQGRARLHFAQWFMLSSSDSSASSRQCRHSSSMRPLHEWGTLRAHSGQASAGLILWPTIELPLAFKASSALLDAGVSGDVDLPLPHRLPNAVGVAFGELARFTGPGLIPLPADPVAAGAGWSL